jgi:Flp pilus assembly protein TadD
MRTAGMVVVGLLLTLSGCGNDDDTGKHTEGARSSSPTASESTVEATASPTAESAAIDTIFVDLAHQNVEAVASMNEADLLELGHTICESVVVGDQTSTLQTLKTLLDAGIPARDAGALMAYASALCPEKQSALTIGG